MKPLIRPAQPEDAPLAVPLLASTLGDLGQDIFGLGSPERLRHVLGIFFISPGHRMSYQVGYIAEVGGIPAGLLMAFPGRRLLRLSLGLVPCIFQAYSFNERWQLIRRGTHLLARPGFSLTLEARPDEFYVAHLATHPDVRRQGLGSALLMFAERLANAAGLSKIALLVAADNLAAIRLYEKSGFIAQPTHGHQPYYFRMVKFLTKRSL
ncbi:GNAT family N-acetyltransferase [uncultured Thermanaerothrix sp.]|uniref:GNAT family N-acetyltransferase n=1 Tax=uncultured Thermanaerothrix sp. TaxID=1195149 RepID=UPI002617427B|nr:GNAT family N-acetyltransferase [uncultured Thermanaerothrix sp.]